MRKIGFLTLSVMLVIGLIAGCSAIAPTQTAQNQGKNSEKFSEPKTSTPTPVESAIAWSEKYAKLSEQMTQEQARNSILKEDNEKLKSQVSTLQSQLDQAQKELTEANSLLVDMRKELNNWKSDVIGFRDEIRNANKAQLEALNRVLSILGGEFQMPAQTDVNSKPESKPNDANQ